MIYNKILLYLFSVVLTASVISCDEAEETTPPASGKVKLVSFRLKLELVNNGSAKWYILASDESGKVLDFAPYTKSNETITLEIDEYQKPTFHFSIIRVFIGNESALTGTTYSYMTVGSDIVLEEPAWENTYKVTVNVTDFDENNPIGFAYSLPGSEQAEQNPNEPIDLYTANSAPLFLATFADYTPQKYHLYSNLTSQDQVLNLPLSDAQTPFGVVNINLPLQDVEDAYVEVYGRKTGENPIHAYHLYNNDLYPPLYNNGGNYALYTASNAFNIYSSYSTVIKSTRLIIHSSRTNSLYNFTVPSFTLNDEPFGANSIDYDLVATGAYARFMFEESRGTDFYTWELIGPAGIDKYLRIPDWPQEITSQFKTYVVNLWQETSYNRVPYILWPKDTGTYNELMKIDYFEIRSDRPTFNYDQVTIVPADKWRQKKRNCIKA